MDLISLVTIIFTMLGIGIPTLISLWVMHRQTFSEMKDFHGRLCTLEERYLQLMQRFLERGDK